MKTKRSSQILIALLAITTLLLSACSAETQTGNNDGFLHKYFVEPFSISIHYIAELFDGNYGLSIILVTLIIRLVLMPLMLKQYKN
jgi:YidC/Oxa1 family membrane protein insertase